MPATRSRHQKNRLKERHGHKGSNAPEQSKRLKYAVLGQAPEGGLPHHHVSDSMPSIASMHEIRHQMRNCNDTLWRLCYANPTVSAYLHPEQLQLHVILSRLDVLDNPRTAMGGVDDLHPAEPEVVLTVRYTVPGQPTAPD
jgi:hypothetical protein